MNLYNMIYKRKSFHLFRNTGDEKITTNELASIKKQFFIFEPLDKSIKVDIKILKGEETNCKREEEYCILLYSETIIFKILVILENNLTFILPH